MGDPHRGPAQPGDALFCTVKRHTSTRHKLHLGGLPAPGPQQSTGTALACSGFLCEQLEPCMHMYMYLLSAICKSHAGCCIQCKGFKSHKKFDCSLFSSSLVSKLDSGLQKPAQAFMHRHACTIQRPSVLWTWETFSSTVIGVPVAVW